MANSVVMPRLLSRYRREVEQGLRRSLSSILISTGAVIGMGSPLCRMIYYHLGFQDQDGRSLEGYPGKLLRPSLLLFACEALGGEPEAALPAAVALELVHSFSLAHDDLQDRDEERHGRPTAWRLFGPAQAINLGDGLRELGALTLFELEQHSPPGVVLKASKILAQATLEMIEGQTLDLDLEAKVEVKIEEYETMALRKTGALFGAALELGALFAGEDREVLETFRDSGRSLGLAFQGRDDVLGIWGEQARTGKAPKSDLLRKKKSLPIVLALEREGAEGPLHTIYRRREFSEADLPRIIELLEGFDVRAVAEAWVERYSHQALAGLERLALPDWARAELKELVRFLMVREY